MHHKILKHLLSLFFVLILLTIMSLQWAVVKNGPTMKETMQQETEHYRFQMPKYTRKSGKTAGGSKDILKPFKAYAFQGRREKSIVKREHEKKQI